MGSLSSYLPVILVFCWMMKIQSVKSRENTCPISTDIHEFKTYYETVKEILHSKDSITDVSLLKANVLNHIHHSEQCCFLLKLGHFYLNNVFPNLELPFPNMQKNINRLANSMLGLKTELKHCHSTMRCPCGQQTHTIMEDFKDTFYQMETEAASVKAIGDLNILFRWMEKKILTEKKK